jgi:D-glycero-alpha-D-manno-heptose-7-phosphate kinase
MVISQTPLRISFAGGGTDFKEFYLKKKGCVISATINKYLYVIVKKRYDDLIVLHYTHSEIVNSVNEIKHDLLREALLRVEITHGIEITTLADIPSEGSGLGSSSAITVGILNALYAFKGITVSNETLAKEACEIEINILNKPIGKQDQYIAAYGGLCRFDFLSNGNVDVYKYKLSDHDLMNLGSNLLLHSTNTARSADDILYEQKANSENIFDQLELIGKMVDELHENLLIKNYSKIGELLKLNWEIKKKLASRITNVDIENLVQLAYDNGSVGSKIAGAGGGGFLLSYVPRIHQEAFRKALAGYRELPFNIDKYGSRIIFNSLP